jgi:hypothetical protein
MPAEQYSIDDIKVFVDGVELDGLKELGITPKDKDNVKPIKDWADRTKGWAIKKNTDAEGSITLLMSAEANNFLLEVAESKRPVQVVVVSENVEQTRWSKITIDQCHFFLPEVKPDPEEPKLTWEFIGTNYKKE